MDRLMNPKFKGELNTKQKFGMFLTLSQTVLTLFKKKKKT